ncbi:MAG: calcium-binding protein, partial [Pseudodonghicola sp.]
MRVVSYVPFQAQNLFFLGTITSATATRIVIEDVPNDRKAVYEGVFSYPGGFPSGAIEGLTLSASGTVQAVFSQADWDATAYFTLLAIAVAGGDVQPLIDLVTAADDVAIGSEFSDWFEGGGGNDIVLGRGGHDILEGGPGDDIARGGLGQDQIYGGPGNDMLFGGQDDDMLIGNKGDDLLTGGLGHDNFYGGAGRDIFYVDDDDYVIQGGPGRDTLSLEGYDAGVTLTGSAGYLPYWEMRVWGTQQQISDIEIVLGSAYSDCLYVNGFAGVVRAGAGNDGVQGGAIDERFFGGAGADVLAGGDGADRLFGGAQGDT